MRKLDFGALLSVNSVLWVEKFLYLLCNTQPCLIFLSTSHYCVYLLTYWLSHRKPECQIQEGMWDPALPVLLLDLPSREGCLAHGRRSISNIPRDTAWYVTISFQRLRRLSLAARLFSSVSSGSHGLCSETFFEKIILPFGYITTNS